MKRSILIVDDMDINREILAEAFRDKYDIIEAENGSIAIRCINDKSLDIAAVLLDMVMPEADGIEVLKKMNENGTILHIPAFIITAQSDEATLMQAYALGGYPHKISGGEIVYYTNMLSLCIEFDRLFFVRPDYNDIQFDFIMREINVEIGRFNPEYVNLLNRCRNQIIMYYRLLMKE